MPGINNADALCQHTTLLESGHLSLAIPTGHGTQCAHSLLSRQTGICSFVVLLVQRDILEVLRVWVTVHGRTVHRSPFHE
jgi:hypothetical protein